MTTAATPTPLLERDAELELIARVLDAARTGEGASASGKILRRALRDRVLTAEHG